MEEFKTAFSIGDLIYDDYTPKIRGIIIEIAKFGYFILTNSQEEFYIPGFLATERIN